VISVKNSLINLGGLWQVLAITIALSVIAGQKALNELEWNIVQQY
jgi:hypothetical protein